MHEHTKFSIPTIRNFVPEKIKPWILIIFVIVFQFSGGVYLAAVSEMVGSLALMQEDIQMAGYASMVGMALNFSIIFRLKFRFTSKWILISCSLVLIACNFICMHASSVPLLVAICFIAGFFRMWATFECNSIIQLWITPTRDLSVFFCYIYLIVQGCIQFSGLTTIYTAFLAKWEYMHLISVALLGLLLLVVVICFRTSRVIKKLPLYGIDWLGGLLWGLTGLSAIFVCVYGEYYDWFDSPHICAATLAFAVMLALNIWRASFIRHPYISLKTWRFPIVYLTFAAYMAVYLLLSPSHLFEHIFMEQTLGYDTLNLISLNWVALLGIAAGAFFTWRTFAVRKWQYKTMNVIGISAIIAHLVIFYFTIDYNLSKEMLILPIFLRTFGYVIIGVCFLTSLTRVPFQYFPQALTIQNFVGASFGSALGTAVLARFLKIATQWNSLYFNANFDNVNPIAQQSSPADIYAAIQQQAMLVSMKDLYGWLAIFGIICLLLFLANASDLRPKYVIQPTFKAIRKLAGRREL
ncbi:MAG: hypothetical protein LBN27_01615 [Prevotellaceae bacterium]|jgi:hypothetical protein|nr:hypothetical protein [Prevotellaceae bacterium]